MNEQSKIYTKLAANKLLEYGYSSFKLWIFTNNLYYNHCFDCGIVLHFLKNEERRKNE